MFFCARSYRLIHISIQIASPSSDLNPASGLLFLVLKVILGGVILSFNRMTVNTHMTDSNSAKKRLCTLRLSVKQNKIATLELDNEKNPSDLMSVDHAGLLKVENKRTKSFLVKKKEELDLACFELHEDDETLITTSKLKKVSHLIYNLRMVTVGIIVCTYWFIPIFFVILGIFGGSAKIYLLSIYFSSYYICVTLFLLSEGDWTNVEENEAM